MKQAGSLQRSTKEGLAIPSIIHAPVGIRHGVSVMLFQIKLNNVTAGVEVTDGIITDAAPIFKKFIGARFIKFKAWVERQGGYVGLVSVESNANED